MDKKYLEALKEVRVILSDKNRWTMNHLATDSNGFFVPINNVDAVCWCLSGALCLVTGEKYSEPSEKYNYFYKWLNKMSLKEFGAINIETLNDHDGYDTVIKFLDITIERFPNDLSR